MGRAGPLAIDDFVKVIWVADIGWIHSASWPRRPLLTRVPPSPSHGETPGWWLADPALAVYSSREPVKRFVFSSPCPRSGHLPAILVESRATLNARVAVTLTSLNGPIPHF